MSEPLAVTDQLERAYAKLSPKLQQAARFVLDAPDDVALSSVRSVAHRAGVHPATLVRLAQHLGFSGYVEFRDGLRQRLRHAPASLTSRAHRVQAEGQSGADEGLMAELSTSGRRNVELTFEGTTASELRAVADALTAARRVYVIGLRKCFPVAYFIHYCLRLLRTDVRLITDLAGTLVDELQDIGPADAMIAISYDPYTRATVQAVAAARDSGAVVIAITDSRVSPLAEGARQTLVVANAAPTMFRSITGAMALAESIVAFVLARGGEDRVANLGRTEAKLHRMGIYWQEDAMRGWQA